MTINSLALNTVRASFCSAAGSISGPSPRDRRQTTVVSRGRLQDTGFRQASSKAVHGETSGKICSSSVGLLLVFSRDRRQTSSAAQVLIVVLEIVCKTVDRRQTSSTARILIVVLEIVCKWKLFARQWTDVRQAVQLEF